MRMTVPPIADWRCVLGLLLALCIVLGFPVRAQADDASPEHARLAGKHPAEALQPPGHTTTVAATRRMAPTAETIWLRQSLAMKTIGSSCISPRRASTQIRRVR